MLLCPPGSLWCLTIDLNRIIFTLSVSLSKRSLLLQQTTTVSKAKEEHKKRQSATITINKVVNVRHSNDIAVAKQDKINKDMAEN